MPCSARPRWRVIWVRSRLSPNDRFSIREGDGMAWEVVMEEDGTITLPPDLIDKLGWTPKTLLSWTDEEGGVSLGPAKSEVEPGKSA